MKKRKPKDLGLKFGTKEEGIWTEVAREAKMLIEQSEQNLVVQKAILDLANEKIAAEKQKL